MASFLRHRNTMESPPNPSYLYGGPQPVDDIQDLRQETSMENLVGLQRYLERFQFETTCLRLWSNGIQDQIMDETQRVHTYKSRMTEELNRVRCSQPQGWLQQWQKPVSRHSHQLQSRVQHRLRHQLIHQLQVHRLAFLSKQLQCQRIQEWPTLQRTLPSQAAPAQIHGLSTSLGASDACPRGAGDLVVKRSRSSIL